MRFWIDIANSPHAPFFAPISDALEERGHEIVVTAWDRAQTLDLAMGFWPGLTPVGAGASAGVAGKGLRMLGRVQALKDAVKDKDVDVALSHGSYGQIMAGRLLRKRVITMMDYEHQPANHLSFRLAHVVIVPESFPQAAAKKFGARRKLKRYAGYKEEISLATFEPDVTFRRSLDVDDDQILVVARTPPEGALYHRHSNDLFQAALERVTQEDVVVILSPRDEEQGEKFKNMRRVRVLDKAVDGANLLYQADLVLGGGGTMTREAAVLGTPTYTLFSGEPAAVDEALIAEGRLKRISQESDLGSIRIAQKAREPWTAPRDTIAKIVELIERGATAKPGT